MNAPQLAQVARALIVDGKGPFSVAPGREHPDGGGGHHAGREPAEDVSHGVSVNWPMTYAARRPSA